MNLLSFSRNLSRPYRSRIFFVLLMMSISGLASAEVYRWVDADGLVHYSDRPGPAAAQVELANPNDSAGYVVPEEEETGDSEAAATARARAEQCELAKTRLESYRKAGTVVRKDETGEESEISADDRIKLIVKTEAQVETLCSKKTAAAS